MAALDFPNSPTTNQQYAAPNGVTYQWDGAAWVVTGGPPGQLWTGGTGTLTPTDTTKRVVIPGPTAGGADQTPLVLGSRTMKGREVTLPSVDQYGLTYNGWYDGTSWHADDSTKPVWQTVVGASPGDAWLITRAAGTTPGSGAQLLTLDNLGNLTLGPGAGTLKMYTGASTTRVELNGTLATNLYYTGSAWTEDDTTHPGWQLQLNSSADNLSITRLPAASSALATVLTLDNAGNLTVLGSLSTGGITTAYSDPGIRVAGATAGVRFQGTGTALGDGFSNAIAFGWTGSAVTCRVDNYNAGTVNITAPSDERLKQEIAEDTPGLAVLSALRPVGFSYRHDIENVHLPSGRHFGLIAQEARAHVPFAIEDDGSEQHYLSLDYRALVPVLIRAIQELAAETAALKAQCQTTSQPAPAAS